MGDINGDDDDEKEEEEEEKVKEEEEKTKQQQKKKKKKKGKKKKKEEEEEEEEEEEKKKKEEEEEEEEEEEVIAAAVAAGDHPDTVVKVSASNVRGPGFDLIPSHTLTYKNVFLVAVPPDPGVMRSASGSQTYTHVCKSVVRTDKPGAGIMEADDRQVTTVFTVQSSFHRRHTTHRVS